MQYKQGLPRLILVVRGFKTGCTRAWWGLTEGRETFGEPKGTGAQPPAAPAPAGSAPVSAGSAPVLAGSPAGPSAGSTAGPSAGSTASPVNRPLLFEKGYCDKILLRPGQLDNWKRYLDDNPRRLAIKRQHPDYFTIMHQISIGEWSCQAVGNRFLLNNPEKAAVIVHSAYNDAKFAEMKAQWLALAENGGVLISAAIATRKGRTFAVCLGVERKPRRPAAENKSMRLSHAAQENLA